MRKLRPVLVIGFSILMGISAVGAAANWLRRQNGLSTTKVLVAVSDLPAGTRLSASMLESIAWPSNAPLKDPLISIAQAQERVLNMPVLKGEPIVANKLAALGEKGGLSAMLRDGKRAVTVKVNEVVGVAGFALPGNYVDVMVNTQDGSENLISKIVLERIQVLAVAQDIGVVESSKPKVVNAVTLEVTPHQAEQIDLARSVGTLSLVLRSQLDTDLVVTTGARKIDLFAPPKVEALVAKAAGDKVPKAPKVSSPPRPEKMEVIRGLSKAME
jgi:pilus assembly protein CpaB